MHSKVATCAGKKYMFVTSLLITKHLAFTRATVLAKDTFADARQNDVQNLAEEMEDEIEHDRKALAKVFQRTPVLDSSTGFC